MRGRFHLVLGLGALAVALALPFVGLSSRWLQLLALLGINVLLAQSMNIVGGFAGQISLGHAGLFAAGAYGSAVLSVQAGWPVWLSVPAGVMIAMAVGLVVAFPAERVRDFYLGMVTLGFGVVANEVLQYWEPVTGGFMGLSSIPSPTLRNLVIAGHRVTLAEFYLATVLIVALATWLMANLVQSQIGRSFVAVSESDVVPSCLGIPPGRTKHLAYVASAAWAGLAGGLYAHLIAYISPEAFNLWTSVAILVMAVFGGFRTFAGPFLGAAFFTLLPEFTQDFKDYQLLVYGLVLLGSYALLPRGVAGLLRQRSAYIRVVAAPQEAGPIEIVRPKRLVIERLSKRFGGLHALSNVSLTVEPGTIHGLLGPNGSGKSTLVNVVSGIFPPSEGRVTYGDRAIQGKKPFEIVRAGLVRTFQNPQLFAGMTVRENVLAAAHGRYAGLVPGAILRTPRFRRVEAAAAARADAILDRVGLAENAGDLGADLPYGKKRLLDVARCLAADPAILILDEPAAGLSEPELARLAALLRDLNRSGMTILLIEHHLDFLFGLVGSVTVLDHGEVIFDGSPEAARRAPQVVEAYLGAYAHAA